MLSCIFFSLGKQNITFTFIMSAADMFDDDTPFAFISDHLNGGYP